MLNDKTETEFLHDLHDQGFKAVADGSAVIVIGKSSEIPLDRPVGAFDLRSTTRARRFDSAKTAVATLIAR